MANLGTRYINDLFGWSNLTAPSSIYPASQADAQLAATTARPEEVDSLLPWGCEQGEQVPQDQA